MSILIDISDETRMQLEKKAVAAGVDVPTYAARILAAEASRPTLEAALRDVRAAFRASGMSEDELAETLEREKHEARELKLGVRFRE